MNYKIILPMIFLSMFFLIVFGIDKLTSENPSDSASIRIGLSNIDSSTCKICEINGDKYNGGCKHCIQDGVVLTLHETFYSIGWSNNDGMYHGDKICDGSKNFENTFANENDTYFVEIIKDGLILKTDFYNDENFTNLKESISLEMCSNPTNLQYLRISNEDGKPSGNGGKISGFIDEIQISKKIDDKIISTFFTSFDNCTDNTCGNTWTLHNSDRIFIDPKNNFLSFITEVSGTHDYAHLKLEQELPNSWLMKFKFHINDLEEHPRGKGILNIDPELREILLIIPVLIVILGILKMKTQNKKNRNEINN